MRIAIFGLGCVGGTMAACLARDGHQVLGIDIDPARVERLATGRAPVLEPELDDLLRAGRDAGRLQARLLPEAGLDGLDQAIVCVGTPGRPDGELDLSGLMDIVERLGTCVRRRDSSRPPLLITVRSTVPPGTMERAVLPALTTAAGEEPGARFELAYNPEFLRAGSAVRDYLAPSRIVVGERFPGASGRLQSLYEAIPAPLFEVPFAVAEAVKLVDNAWHALKVTFGNEIGRLCWEHGIRPGTVADIFLADTRLNLSAAYLRPGQPYGGPCLPKDLAALAGLGTAAGLDLPLLGTVAESNRRHGLWLLDHVRRKVEPPGPILLLGLSFKAGTDRLEASPALALAESLVAEGYRLLLHDPDLGEDPLPQPLSAMAARIVSETDPSIGGARLVLQMKPMRVPGIELDPAIPLIDLSRPDLAGLPPGRNSGLDL